MNKTVLTIAGTDPSGGAGVAADLKAFSSLDLHGACVITAITSQNTCIVNDIFPIGSDTITSQLDAVFDDLEIGAVKTGMLFSADIVEAVSRKLKEVKVPLVVDPVLKAGVGSNLFREDLIDSMTEKLFPIATLVTPNRMEAGSLTASEVVTVEDAEDACHAISRTGAGSVLLKGGHFEGDMSTDLLFCDDVFTEYSSPRLDVKVHGSGCTLSSYIAGYLSQGKDVRTAVAASKRRIYDAIAMSLHVGHGMSVINPMATKQKQGMMFGRSETISLILGKDRKGPIGPSLRGRCDAIAFALPNPQDLAEICSSSRAVDKEGSEFVSPGFGRSENISWALLTMARIDRHVLSAVRLSNAEKMIDRLKDEGITFESMPEVDGSESMANNWSEMGEHSKQLGFVPDTILLGNGMGKERQLLVFGKDPEDILYKLGPLLD